MQTIQEKIEEIEKYILANRIMILELAKVYIKNDKQLLKWMDDCEKDAERLYEKQIKKSIDKKER